MCGIFVCLFFWLFIYSYVIVFVILFSVSLVLVHASIASYRLFYYVSYLLIFFIFIFPLFLCLLCLAFNYTSLASLNSSVVGVECIQKVLSSARTCLVCFVCVCFGGIGVVVAFIYIFHSSVAEYDSNLYAPLHLVLVSERGLYLSIYFTDFVDSCTKLSLPCGHSRSLQFSLFITHFLSIQSLSANFPIGI